MLLAPCLAFAAPMLRPCLSLDCAHTPQGFAAPQSSTDLPGGAQAQPRPFPKEPRKPALRQALPCYIWANGWSEPDPASFARLRPPLRVGSGRATDAPPTAVLPGWGWLCCPRLRPGVYTLCPFDQQAPPGTSNHPPSGRLADVHVVLGPQPMARWWGQGQSHPGGCKTGEGASRGELGVPPWGLGLPAWPFIATNPPCSHNPTEHSPQARAQPAVPPSGQPCSQLTGIRGLTPGKRVP